MMYGSHIRQNLFLAENAMEEQNYLDVIVFSRNAFQNLIYETSANDKLFMELLPSILFPDKAMEDFSRGIRQLTREIDLLKTGICINKFNKYFEIVKYIPFERNFVSVEYYSGNSEKWSLENAQFCFAFVSESTLNIEEKAANSSIEMGKQTNTKTIFEINGIALGEELEDYQFRYIGQGEIVEKLIFKDDSVEKFSFFKRGDVYSRSERYFTNGIQESLIESEMKLLCGELIPLTNNPNRIMLLLRSVCNIKHDLTDTQILEISAKINQFGELMDLTRNINDISKMFSEKFNKSEELIRRLIFTSISS